MTPPLLAGQICCWNESGKGEWVDPPPCTSPYTPNNITNMAELNCIFFSFTGNEYGFFYKIVPRQKVKKT